MSEWQGKQMLVLGLGESGLASACWCAAAGARVRVADTRANPPYLAELRRRATSTDFLAGAFDLALLDGIDVVVLSPGLPSDLPIVRQAMAQGLPVIGEIELFARALRELNLRAATPASVLAITGTNGKTTTTALTGHLLRGMGQKVGVAGNISPAALTALANHVAQHDLPQVWVLELSSFQLETTTSLQPAAATVLNISDDHLDRYADLAAYAAVKARIFQGAAVQVVNRQDNFVRNMVIPGRRMISFGLDAPQTATDFGLRQQAGELWLTQGEQCLLPVSRLPMQGLHNATNVMAALALCVSLGYDVQQLLPAVLGFQGLPHRVEKVAEINGVTWYDDSKGTNVGATVAALEGICGQMAAQNNRLPSLEREDTQLIASGNQHDRKIVLIAGGDGKGQDFSPLAPAVAQCARAVVLIGRDGSLIGNVLEKSGVPLVFATDMSDAVQQAHALAHKTDAVLLSPACASFDMFRDYEHRAAVFIAAAKSLVKAAS